MSFSKNTAGMVALALMFSSSIAFAQTGTVTGGGAEGTTSSANGDMKDGMKSDKGMKSGGMKNGMKSDRMKDGMKDDSMSSGKKM